MTQFIRFFASTTSALLCFAGCSTGNAQRVTPNFAASGVFRTDAKSAGLYVADLAAITVYGPGSDSPQRRIANVDPSAIALDASSNLYVANVPAGGSGSVTVYRARTSKLLRTIKSGVNLPRALAFDTAGNLYVANSYFRIAVFAPGKSGPSRYIKVFYPAAMIFDRSSDLYVASDASPYGGQTSTKILTYAPDGRLVRTIVNGLNDPIALGFNDAGNLFVANYSGNNVTVYAAGNTSVIQTISDGIKGPYALLFDKAGDLFVANNLASTITVYQPGSTDVLRTIRQGVSHPTALIFDSEGNLYVANEKNITMYAPGADVPKRTIVKGVKRPIALRFGP